MFSIIDLSYLISFFFFFNDTATTEIYTLSLHDALPICTTIAARHITPPHAAQRARSNARSSAATRQAARKTPAGRDRKSTRLNSSHGYISYAVFCLKKKKNKAKRKLHHTTITDHTAHYS